MEQYDPRVDAYIAKSADFAQPILKHIRQIVHEASPLITENIKWGMPFLNTKARFAKWLLLSNTWALDFGKQAV